MGIIWRELFPTKISIFIFIGYMSLFISQGILVTASQESNNSYKYDTVTVVLLTECLKLIISTALYCKDNAVSSLIQDVKKDSKLLALYLIPAFLYCLYNNLAFINLSTFDPTTYYLLLQFRVVITGVLFQIVFKKYLTQRQWISLLLLTAGCMVKQVHFGDEDNIDDISNKNSTTIGNNNTNGQNGKNMNGFDLSFSAIFILAQTICSCLAGVYNEHLLKDKGANVNIFIQNIFMYLDSILCNVLVILFQGNLSSAFSLINLNKILSFNVIIIIINNAAIGIITSFFLKYMNSILKTFAGALELLFTAILCYLLFSIPIYLNTVLSIFIVSFAVYLYSQSPVVNTGKLNILSNKHTEDKRKLLDDGDTDLEMDNVV